MVLFKKKKKKPFTHAKNPREHCIQRCHFKDENTEARTGMTSSTLKNPGISNQLYLK